jgi:amidase
MRELYHRPASELAQLIRNNEISSLELTQLFLSRIREKNSRLNSVVLVMEEDALRVARSCDEELGLGQLRGPFHGVPITIKESFDIAGQPTTANFRRFKDNIAQADSLPVARMRAAGAVILGKTNVPTLLADIQTQGDLFPRANNPYDLARTTGGSTGGGAAALAAGLSALEIGSDIGGSIRTPANFCGVYGLKPTENAYPQLGQVPPAPGSRGGVMHMASFGPLARSVEDLRLAFEVLRAPEPRYGKLAPIAWQAPSERGLAGLSIAWADSLGADSAGSEVKQALGSLMASAARAGARTTRISPLKLDMEAVFEAWATLFAAIAAQDLSFFLRLGLQLYYRFFSGLKEGRHAARGASGNLKAYSRALRTGQESRALMQDFFTQYDCWVTPVAMGPAFLHSKSGKKIALDGQELNYYHYVLPFTVLQNLTGIPSVVIPAGQSKEGLPIGLQISGPLYSEPELLHIASLLASLTPGFQPPAEGAAS